MAHDTNTNTERIGRDPGQIVPDQIETAPEIVGSMTLSDMKAQLPAAAAVVVTGYGAVSGNLPLLAAGGGSAALLALAGLAFRATDRWYTTPADRIRGRVAYARRDKGEDLVVLPDVHGVEAVTDRGYVRLDDGRVVALVRVHPRNTALLDDDERHTLASLLSGAIDEQIHDIPFRLFSTTRDYSVADIADRYATRSADPSMTEDQQAVLFDVSEWLADVDNPNWDAREWQHYLAVEASAADVVGPEPSFISMLNPLSDTDAETVDDDKVDALLADRVERVIGAIESVPGLEAEPPDSGMSIDVVRRFWGWRTDAPAGLAANAANGTGATHIETLVAPSMFDARKGWVDLGEQYARSLWLVGYPTEPDSLWLKSLTSIRGVDVDLCVNVTPEPAEDAIHDVGLQIADVGSEGEERAEEGDISATDADSANDALVRMRALFRDTPTQPWRLSTYVIVRADDRDSMAVAAETIGSFADVDGARRAALDAATDDVVDVLSRSPANATTHTPSISQELAFKAASPLTGDVWDESTAAKAPKTRRVPGGVIGSMFPFAAMDFRESDGMDWGRNEENGALIRLSPFRRGGAPHMLTIGQSRSGKTYSASKAALRWYLERDDRTLIVCDTQRGFDGLTSICGGKHVVVDGGQAVNPLHIEPSADRAEGADEFRLTVEETVGFLVSLLRADDVEDAGTYAPLLSQAAERTLTNAGINPSAPETFARESPDLSDLLATLIDMNDNPKGYTWSDEGMEGEIHRRDIGELLTKLRSFQADGKYARLVGEDEIGVVDDDVDMAYLDLHALAGSGDAEKSAMLQLMLSQVREKIKKTPGETIFLLDEAHVLLDNERTADWLQKAAREFARYDACLWFLSQFPKDFVSDDDESEARDIIRGQCSMIHFFRTPHVDEMVLEQFGMNETQRRFALEKAVRGWAGRGYSECLIDAVDIEGWLPCYVQSSPIEDGALTGSGGSE